MREIHRPGKAKKKKNCFFSMLDFYDFLLPFWDDCMSFYSEKVQLM